MKTIVAAVAVGLVAGAAWAEEQPYPKAKVSFDDYKTLVAEVESHRASRLVDLDTFLAMSREEGVVILDCRSDFRFERIHLKGARHLAFTEFTEKNLAQVIPSFETKILIYCNNNFAGNERDFASKVAPARPRPGRKAASQFAAEARPLMMALNIPTFIALHGYGYHDVYELDELVDVNDPRVAFEGTAIDAQAAGVVPPASPRQAALPPSAAIAPPGQRADNAAPRPQAR